jgi:peptidoglycan/xylan/chitin deacetylase (PgdA/CDA1 family)
MSKSGFLLSNSPKMLIIFPSLKAMYAGSHTIGSHGWSHAHMGQLTWDQAHDELWRIEQAMIKILGVKPLCKCCICYPLSIVNLVF